MAWGVMIAWYLFLAGISAGAYVTAYWVSKKFPAADTIRRTGFFLSPVLLAIGLLLLVFDAEAGIQHPLRFIYLLSNVVGSMMTDGTYIISLFFVIGAYQAFMVYKGKKVASWIEKLGVIFAFGTAAYTGLLIGVVKAVPLWNSSILPVLFTVSAGSTGIAITVLLATLRNRNACQNMISLKKLHFSLMALEAILIFIMFYITSSANEVAYQSIKGLLVGEWSLLFWIGLLGIGLVVPMLIEGIEIYHGYSMHKPVNLEVSATTVLTKPNIFPLLVTESAVLIGGFILRYLILVAALPTNLF